MTDLSQIICNDKRQDQGLVLYSRWVQSSEDILGVSDTPCTLIESRTVVFWKMSREIEKTREWEKNSEI